MNKSKIVCLLFLITVASSSVFGQRLKQTFKDTTCTNIDQINSLKDDYLPFLIDKTTLFFTSNRKNTQESQTVEYSEKVYFSTLKGKKWAKSQKTGYKWNSDNNTALVGLSATKYYFYRAYWKDNGEIFSAERFFDKKNPWKASSLKKLNRICTDEFSENSISEGNGDTVYFASNRNGHYDLFMQIGRNYPLPLEKLNTEYNEQDVFFDKFTQKIYFSSDRPEGFGGFDIFESKLNTDGTFSPAKFMRDTLINSSSNDRDFRWYNDSTMYLASDRIGGKGGYDIYEILVKTRHIFEPDSPKISGETDMVDSLKKERSELIAKLKEMGLFPFKGEVQVGAYRFIPSLTKFQETFPCIKTQNVRMDMIIVDGTIKVHKYIIDTVYTDIDKALDKQQEITNMHCLPEELFSDMPFIGMLDKDGNRFAVFWKKDEFLNKKVFYIFKNGKMVWKGRRF